MAKIILKDKETGGVTFMDAEVTVNEETLIIDIKSPRGLVLLIDTGDVRVVLDGEEDG